MSVLLDRETRVMVQGITGDQVRPHVRHMLDYGTRIACGVSPRKGVKEVLGVPVYNTIREALREHTVDITVLFVSARYVKSAAIEAIENKIPTIFVLEDGVAIHDTSEILTRASAAGVRIVGPSSQGMITPGKAKLGGTGGAEPWRLFHPGRVGIISRSGGMGVEISLLLTRNGIGQSTYIAIGGDLMIGTSFRDLMPMFEADLDTDALVIFGEPGTNYEEEASELIASGAITKPVIAFIAGRSLEHLPAGLTFGHTSVIVGSGVHSALAKQDILRQAGALVAERFGEIPDLVRSAMSR